MPWILLAVFLWGLVHSLLASDTAKGWAQRVFGPRAFRLYRLGYNAFASISFLPILVLLFLVPDRNLYLVPLPWSGLMILGELLAATALVVGLRQTDTWEFIGLRVRDKTEKPPRLTTSGLYQYVRHPLYTAGMAFIWLLPLMTTNILAVNIGLTVYVIIGAAFEERKLGRVFGKAYADYKMTTPMFIPFTMGNKSRRKSSGL